MQINGKTRIVAVLGHPVAHTASPAMHNAAFDALGLNWRYVALDVDPSRLEPVLQGLAQAGFAGVNLTVPHKLMALCMLDLKDASVKELGATNTLSFISRGSGVKIHGFNTDGYGLLKGLKEAFHFSPKGKRIAVVGCGGAGRGAAIQLARAGAAKLILINRTRAKATALAKELQRQQLRVECSFAPEKVDLVVQATSLGLCAGDELPVTRDQLSVLEPRFFYDMVYRPAETAALRLALKMGCRGANGLGMLLHQGARAFEIWTGRKAPVDVMRRALLKEIYGKAH